MNVPDRRPQLATTEIPVLHALLRQLMDFLRRIQDYFPGRHHDVVAKPVEEEVPKTSLEEKQRLLAHHVRLVARGISMGLFVAGVGGLGKSRTIQQTLIAEGVTPILVNSHITPLSLYRLLFENRCGRVIWLDDCDSIYGNLQVLGLLRSALWGQPDRIVTYASSQLDDIPGQFVFESRIIFCANTIPTRNEAFKAVLSRVDCFELEAANEELLEQMRLMAGRGYRSLTSEQCLEVVEFIQRSAGTRQLSMRLYEPSLRKVLYAQQAQVDWRDLVRCQLDQIGRKDVLPPEESREIDFAVMAQAITEHPESVKQQEEFWCAARSKSRASFFRTKKAWEEQQRGEKADELGST